MTLEHYIFWDESLNTDLKKTFACTSDAQIIPPAEKVWGSRRNRVIGAHHPMPNMVVAIIVYLKVGSLRL